jgi:hypothetical protein
VIDATCRRPIGAQLSAVRRSTFVRIASQIAQLLSDFCSGLPSKRIIKLDVLKPDKAFSRFVGSPQCVKVNLIDEVDVAGLQHVVGANGQIQLFDRCTKLHDGSLSRRRFSDHGWAVLPQFESGNNSSRQGGSRNRRFASGSGPKFPID